MVDDLERLFWERRFDEGPHASWPVVDEDVALEDLASADPVVVTSTTPLYPDDPPPLRWRADHDPVSLPLITWRAP